MTRMKTSKSHKKKSIILKVLPTILVLIALIIGCI